jgi:hypothetical protein
MGFDAMADVAPAAGDDLLIPASPTLDMLEQCTYTPACLGFTATGLLTAKPFPTVPSPGNCLYLKNGRHYWRAASNLHIHRILRVQLVRRSVCMPARRPC